MHEYQCKYCHEIYSGTVCPGCGAPVASATPVTGTYTVAQRTPKSYSAGKRGLKNSKELWIIGICLAAVFITFIICRSKRYFRLRYFPMRKESLRHLFLCRLTTRMEGVQFIIPPMVRCRMPAHKSIPRRLRWGMEPPRLWQ